MAQQELLSKMIMISKLTIKITNTNLFFEWNWQKYFTITTHLHCSFHLFSLNLGLQSIVDEFIDEVLLLEDLDKSVFFLKLSRVSPLMKRSRACLNDECFLSKGFVYILNRVNLSFNTSVRYERSICSDALHLPLLIYNDCACAQVRPSSNIGRSKTSQRLFVLMLRNWSFIKMNGRVADVRVFFYHKCCTHWSSLDLFGTTYYRAPNIIKSTKFTPLLMYSVMSIV